MKRVLVICFSLTSTFVTLGQQVPKTGLKVGEQLPDLSVGKVIDNDGNLSSTYQGKARFSDFRGKLVILDFWATSCSSCIKGFKKMSFLQERYKDKIQIFLVNTYENEIKVKNWIQKNKSKGNTDIIPENLSIIADAKELFKLFPIRGEIGYHVWIDKKGIVKIRGISENTHEKKIEEILSGKDVSYIQDNALAYKPRYPYFFSNLSPSGKSPLYGSSFGLFDDIHASAYGAAAENFIDSVHSTRRNTFLNYSILDLFQKALEPQLLKDSNILYGNRISIESEDFAPITQNEKKLNRAATDNDYRNRLCYEQIVSLSLPDSTGKENMLYDLNRFLIQNFSLQGKWEKRSVPCLKLTFFGDVDKIKSKEGNYEAANNQALHAYNGVTARSAFREYFTMLDLFNAFRADCIIIDNTFLEGKMVDLKLPVLDEFKSPDEFSTILKSQGFELVPDSTTTRIFVISNINQPVYGSTQKNIE